MLEFEQLNLRLVSNREELLDLKDALGYDRLKRDIDELEMKSAEPGFWDDPETSQKIVGKTGRLKNTVELYDKSVALYDDLEVLIQMGDEEGDLSLIPEIEASLNELENSLASQRLQTLLTGEYEKNNAI